MSILFSNIFFRYAHKLVKLTGFYLKYQPARYSIASKINIAIKDNHRSEVSKILNALLANEYLLYTKTRNYHWNITGPQFNDLHKFFEAQYTELNIIVDDVAERTRALGAASHGSMAEFLAHTTLKEAPGKAIGAKISLTNLLLDHEAIIRDLRRDLDLCSNQYGDMGTSDFLTGLMEQHEKMAWMLRSFLERS